MHEVELRFTDGEIIRNADIAEESLEIYERICSEDRLVYGSCEPTTVKVRIRSDKAYKLRTFDLYYDGALQGTFRVENDKATSDRCYKDIIAYDKLHQILNSVCTAWYNSLEFPMTLRIFREEFFDHYGVTQMEQNLINDNMIVHKTIEAETVNAGTVLKSICELNACFGHIQPNGKFKYITLYAPGMSPSLPVAPYTPITADYEDFQTGMVEKVIIRKEEGDAGATAGTGTNTYIIEDNFLCYGLSNGILQSVAQKIFEQIRLVTYTPMTVTGRFTSYVNVGSIFGFTTNGHGLVSYVLERTITGIQSRSEEIVAQGMKTYKVTTSNYRDQIVLLKNRTNILERNVDETRSTISDLEQGVAAEFVQTANAITAEVTRAQGAEQQLRTAIQMSESAIRAEVTERTSLYNAEATYIQGGTDGKINLDLFPGTYVTTATVQGKQCLAIDPGSGRIFADYTQNIAVPAGTYKLSYEYLRRSTEVFMVQRVAIKGYVDGVEVTFYQKDINGSVTNTWISETADIDISEATRLWFEYHYENVPPAVPDVCLTNIYLMGTGQSIADAIGEMKAEILIQSDKIEQKVTKGEVVASINISPETITIDAQKIDLIGVVNATELQTEFAKVSDLEGTNARIDNITTNYITAATVASNYATIGSLQAQSGRIDRIESSYISADTVKANYMEVANWVSAGKIRADRIDVNSIKANVMTVANISAACNSATQGTISIGSIRSANYQYFNGSSYVTLSLQEITDKNGAKFRCLGYRV